MVVTEFTKTTDSVSRSHFEGQRLWMLQDIIMQFMW